MKKILLYLTIIMSLFPEYLQAQEQNVWERTGFYYGVGLGVMSPTGKLKTIGSSQSVDINFGIINRKMAVGFSFDIFSNSLKSNRPYFNVWHQDSLFKENEYGGANIALQFNYNILSAKRLGIHVTSALGYTDITYKSIEPGKDVNKGSLLFSPGVSFQYFITNQSALWLQLEYQIANRKLKDPFSTDFSGNFFAIKLMYVGYIN